jgi:proline iminopeptidase
MISLLPQRQSGSRSAVDESGIALGFARMSSHYFHHKSFFPQDDWLLSQAHRLHGIPGTLIQGHYDVCTPAKTAHELAALWPDAKLVVIADAGHAGTEPGIADAMVRATEAHATLLV